MLRAGAGLASPTLRLVLSFDERKKRLAYAIRAVRELRGMTPPQLADAIGKGRGTVNKWEAGDTAPSLLDLGPLCEALDVRAEVFADLPPIPRSPHEDYLLEHDAQKEPRLRETG